MTLLIAFLLIHQYDLSSAWYFIALGVWCWTVDWS